MAVTSSTLNILINAKNNAKTELSALQGQLSNLVPGFGMVAKGAGAVGVALAAINAGRAAFEMGEAASASLRLSASFDTLAANAGSSGREMLAAMQQASQGTVSNTELIQAANRAMLLGVASSADEMAQLLEVAGARGKAMGLSTAQAFGDIVTGIGRMSPLILDNLGIVVDAAAANETYAASMGRTAASLTDAEQKQALLNAVIASSADLMGENASQSRDMAGDFEAMRASLDNAKEALGVLFTPAAAAIARDLALAVDSVTAAMTQAAKSDFDKTLEAQVTKMNDLDRSLALLEGRLALAIPGTQEFEQLSIAVEATSDALASQRVLVDALGNAHGSAVTSAARLDQTMAVMANTSQTAAEAELEAANAAAVLAQQQQILQGITDATAAKMERLASIANSAAGTLRSSFAGIAGVIGTGAALENYQKANAELKILSAQWETLGLTEDEIYFRTQEYVKSITDANGELTKTVSTTATLSKEAQAAQAAFDELKNKVAGVLNQQLDTGTGVDPNSLLPREDAINEDARRLADVAVNGFESPWAAYLNEKFPELFQGAFNNGGDLKTAAAQALRDFQDGLNPALLDKDTAKERIKRMLIGEASMAELAGQIAQELSQEMGGQFSLGDIQAATGQILGTGGAQTGADGQPTDQVGQALLAGVEGNNTGAKLVATLAAQIKAGFETLTTNAKEAGAVWGAGFTSVVKENVPPELVSILTALVTPEVYARLQTQATQTGAES